MILRSATIKSSSLFLALVMAGGLFGTVSYATTTGTDSLAITFSSELISDTCSFEVQDGTDAVTSAVDIGNIYKSDVGTDAAEKPFYIASKECTGMSGIYITAQATGGTCDGTNYPTNDAANTDTSIQIHQEEHSPQETPHPLNCAMTPVGSDDAIHRNFGTNRLSTNVTFNMYVILVLANGKTTSDIGISAATAPVTFSISYE